ncbi:hypothetical protein Hdeb2414_s0414g00888641 [Helianthus debilis subsp. tardiflorus]
MYTHLVPSELQKLVRCRLCKDVGWHLRVRAKEKEHCHGDDMLPEEYSLKKPIERWISSSSGLHARKLGGCFA